MLGVEVLKLRFGSWFKNEVVFGCDLVVDVLSGRNFFDVVYICLFAGGVPATLHMTSWL